MIGFTPDACISWPTAGNIKPTSTGRRQAAAASNGGDSFSTGRNDTFLLSTISSPDAATLDSVARKLLIVGLVLVLILLIIPMAISMAIGGCPECPAAGAPMMLTACAILVATILIFAMAMGSGIVLEPARRPAFVFVRGLERPPRSS